MQSIESELNRETKLREELEEKIQKAEQAKESSKITETQLKSQIQTLLGDTVSVVATSYKYPNIYLTYLSEGALRR